MKSSKQVAITLTDFHKYIADREINNLSRFVRTKLLDHSKQEFGIPRHIDIMYGLYQRKEMATVQMVLKGNMTIFITEFLDDMNKMLKGYDEIFNIQTDPDIDDYIILTKEGFTYKIADLSIRGTPEEIPIVKLLLKLFMTIDFLAMAMKTPIKKENKELYRKLGYLYYLIMDSEE